MNNRLPYLRTIIHNPELGDKIAKSAYRPINLSLIGINSDGQPTSSSFSIPDYLVKLNNIV